MSTAELPGPATSKFIAQRRLVQLAVACELMCSFGLLMLLLKHSPRVAVPDDQHEMCIASGLDIQH